ncbi:MAG TPA: hypothetical protein VFG54_12735 [Prolixibacteraceae bacterium]|nr:hypothetical protein [Prolixibacteraceae bacterium]
MDKRKLVNIIIKDLEEIKILSEEVADSENDSSLVLSLALNKARLLCQEIELLRDMTAKSAPVVNPTEDTLYDDDEDEVEDHTYADPELEIINSEDREEEQQEELLAEEEDEDDFEESEEDEFPEEDEDEEDFGTEEQEEELTEQKEEEQEEELPEFIVNEEEEDNWEEEEEELVTEEEEATPAANVQSTELKNGPQPGVREIHIEELDEEDDMEPIRFSPVTGANTRPPMREIPKPEDVISDDSQEKKFVGDKYHEVRSLNDTMGDHKSMDSKIAHSPITSLKSAIGLNDRFLFIREIFNNNSAKYNEVIDRLDQMDQIQEAVEYLRANLSMQKNEASMKFVDLLKRRFTK